MDSDNWLGDLSRLSLALHLFQPFLTNGPFDRRSVRAGQLYNNLLTEQRIENTGSELHCVSPRSQTEVSLPRFSGHGFGKVGSL